MDADLVLFLALSSFAIAIAGATAFVIFWPLALVHIRDRHPPITAQLGEGAFLKPRALWWLLHGDYRAAQDPYLSGLATPSRVSLLVGAMAAILAATIGNTLSYDSTDTARATLMDAEFVEFDGLDEEDALDRGFSLAELAPPQADDDDALRPRMIQQFGMRAR